MYSLLAVDLGLKTGLVLYGEDGRLRWYRSRNFGTPARLRRAVRGLFDEVPDVAWLILEGGGPLADIWEHEAQRRQVAVLRVGAEDWRRRLLNPRQQRDTRQAKRSAIALARRVIEWSDAPRPTSLRHDTAEAILVGLYGALAIGWLDALPPEIRP